MYTIDQLYKLERAKLFQELERATVFCENLQQALLNSSDKQSHLTYLRNYLNDQIQYKTSIQVAIIRTATK